MNTRVYFPCVPSHVNTNDIQLAPLSYPKRVSPSLQQEISLTRRWGEMQTDEEDEAKHTHHLPRLISNCLPELSAEMHRGLLTVNTQTYIQLPRLSNGLVDRGREK